MAMSIGAIGVDIMNGRPAPPAETLEPLPRLAGEDYGRFRTAGTVAPTVQIRTMKAGYATAALADTAAVACQALISTRVTITDSMAVAWTQCMIINVATHVDGHHTGSAWQYRVEAVWTIRQGDPNP